MNVLQDQVMIHRNADCLTMISETNSQKKNCPLMSFKMSVISLLVRVW